MEKSFTTFYAFFDKERQTIVEISKPSIENMLSEKIGGYPVYGVVKNGKFVRVREYVKVPGFDKPFPIGGYPTKRDNKEKARK